MQIWIPRLVPAKVIIVPGIAIEISNYDYYNLQTCLHSSVAVNARLCSMIASDRRADEAENNVVESVEEDPGLPADSLS